MWSLGSVFFPGHISLRNARPNSLPTQQSFTPLLRYFQTSLLLLVMMSFIRLANATLCIFTESSEAYLIREMLK